MEEKKYLCRTIKYGIYARCKITVRYFPRNSLRIPENNFGP